MSWKSSLFVKTYKALFALFPFHGLFTAAEPFETLQKVKQADATLPVNLLADMFATFYDIPKRLYYFSCKMKNKLPYCYTVLVTHEDLRYTFRQ